MKDYQSNAHDGLLRKAYSESLKPYLAHLLEAFGLDVQYHRAQGDRLYYQGSDGEIEVLDFVGGFGASLFGHNHPELVELARQLLAEGRPFHAQASIRGNAGLLAQRLSSAVGRTTGRSYIVTLCSTGTEAVEAAIKHAELEVSRHNQSLFEQFCKDARRLCTQINAGRIRISSETFEEASAQLGQEVHSMDDLRAVLCHRLQETLERPPAFIALAGSFHGKSTGALKLTHRAEFRDPWRRLGKSAAFLPLEDAAAVKAELERMRLPYFKMAVERNGALGLAVGSVINIAAIFLEPIQGEGGIYELSPDFARTLREVADSAGCPLVIDEIQSGMGRSGSFLASTDLGIRGDYYLLSKALGGGLTKISALLIDRDRYVSDFSYLHTSTFADDDFSSVIALRTLEILERNDNQFIGQCRRKGEQLLTRLRQVRDRFPDQVREVRGRGLMIGIELVSQGSCSSPLMRVLIQQGLLSYLACGYLLREHRIRIAPTLSKSAVLRVEPSAFVDGEAIERLGAALEKLCSLLRGEQVSQLLAFMADRLASQESPSAGFVPSVKRRSLDKAENAARVGFLVHFSEPSDLRAWESRLRGFSDADCVRILDRTRGLLRPFILDHAKMQSARNAKVHVTFIGIPFTAEQAVESMRSGQEWTLNLVKEGVRLACDEGCTVVGLGGYTSIVSDDCREIVEDQLTVTSGNSLTVAAACEGWRLAASRLGLDLSSSRMAIVGAAGNVGAVLAEIAADDVGEIVLVSRPGAERFVLPVAHTIYARALKRLRRGERGGIAGRLAETKTAKQLLGSEAPYAGTLGMLLCQGLMEELGDRTPLHFATSLDALRTCQIIASCTSAPSPIILPEHIGRGPVVVCDVAVPRDVDHLVAVERPNAIVIRGGRVWAPLGQTLDVPALQIVGSELYGCLAETLLLGFAGPECPSSYGKLSSFRVRRIRELAAVHGFTIDERSVPLSSLPRS
jgi:acetylornithine/succinyldiaminopimelate/putrescine aminotransferase/predicted amino acid dehydrogenase